MSQENVELVKRAVQAINDRDVETLRTLDHLDAEIHGLADWPDSLRVFRAHDELERALTRTESEFDDFRPEPLELIDAGDRVVVVIEITAIGTGTLRRVRRPATS